MQTILLLFVSCCLCGTVTGYEYIKTLSRDANDMIEGLEATTTPLNGDSQYWKLHSFSAADSTGGRARCLDGSYAGFWFEEGRGDGINKYVVHHMGGGKLMP